MDTMNFWMDIALDDLKKVLTQIDVLTINDEEARQLSGEYSLIHAAQHIHAYARYTERPFLYFIYFVRTAAGCQTVPSWG